MTNEQIFEKYRQKKKSLGKIPKATQFSINFQKDIRKNFGNYFNFLKEVGDFKEYAKEHTSASYKALRTISDEQLISEIKSLYKELGYPPRPKHYKRNPTTINHFGSWHNALKAAGIKGTYYKDYSGSISKEELIVRCKKEADRLGHFPKWSELRAIKYPVSEIHYYFKDLNELALAVGGQSLRAKNRQIYLKRLEKLQNSASVLFNKNKKITYNNLIVETKMNEQEIRSTLDAIYRMKLIKTRRLVELLTLDKRL